MNTMPENAARRYIQANVQAADPSKVNRKAKPLPFKIYRNCEQISLSHVEEGQHGQMLVDLYGLTRQCYSVAMYLPTKETDALPFHTTLLRPVPSGGALFPCELYLLVGPGQHVPAGVYHYDVVHHALDILVQGDATSLLQSALAHPGDTPPACTLLLSSYFWKDGFKYGAFSYRLQGLDIGTIISQSEIITHHAGLSTSIHYQFQDKVLNDLLDLDPLQESVYAVIEWRHREGGVDLQRESQVGLQKAMLAPAFGTVNASALETNETSFRPIAESHTGHCQKKSIVPRSSQHARHSVHCTA
jgi:SagB-type dehydrogenase family enzyme